MADTPPEAGNPAPTGETASQGTVSNDVSQVSAPQTDNTNSAEFEQLKKQMDQEKMRANQLANQLAEKDKAETAARQKQLEEKEEFKTLYEQTQSQLNEIKKTQQEAEQKAALTTATADVFKDYSQPVVELAQTAGLSLTEDTDEARKALKEKLDTFKSKLPSGGVSSNNPHQPAENTNSAELTKRNEDGASPMALAAAKGDLRPTYEYIRGLPAIARMKEISKGA